MNRYFKEVIMLSLNQNMKDKIISFASDKRKVYIYGAGKYGSMCLKILQGEGVRTSGFIETQIHTNKKDNMNVYSVMDIASTLTEKDGIIVAAKEEYRKEMVKNIPVNVPCLYLDDEEWDFLYNEKFYREISGLSVDFPCESIHTTKEWRKILVIRLDAIGDMVWTTSFLRELKSYCVNADITMLIRPELYSLMKNCPYVERILCFECPVPSIREDYGNLRKEASNYARRHLEKENYDVVFLPRVIARNNLLENLYLAIYSGAEQRVGRVGFKSKAYYMNCMNKLFSVLVKERQKGHEVERLLDMLYACDIPVSNKNLELWPCNDTILRIDEILKNRIGGEYKKLLLISIGLVAREGNRTWPTEKYVKVIEKISASNPNVVFILCGGDDAKEAVIKIDKKKSCVDFVGKLTLDETIALLGKCDFYLGSNTGILHIAAAMKKPIVEISGQWEGGDDNSGLSPMRVGAYGVDSIVIRPETAADEECARVGWCIKKDPHCICQISVEKVVQAVNDMIQMLVK